jgi:hypothetical protein
MKRLIVLALFQIVVMLGWAAQNEYVRATAPVFRIPLQPVDPYDVMRGRYFVTNPVDSSIRTGEPGVQLTAAEVERFLQGEASFNGPAQVGFCREGDSHRVSGLAKLGQQPATRSAEYWSRARYVSIQREDTTWRDDQVVSEPGYRVRIDLALDRFFLPNRASLPASENAQGWELELCHRSGLTPLPRRLLFNGQPVLRD